MLFRSLRPLAARGLASGAASALTLTLFTAAQPSLSGDHKIHPGTTKDVPITLTPGVWTTQLVPLPLRLRSPSGGPRLDPGR